MPVIINNKRLLPAPLVSFTKDVLRNENGEVVGAAYKASLQGEILQNKGNPIASTGVSFTSSFSTDSWTSTFSPDDDPLHGTIVEDLLISTITKQEQIRDIFSPATGVKVEIVGFNHNRGLRFYGNVSQISFPPEGRWAMPCQYTVELDFNNFIDSAGSGLFSSASSEDAFQYYLSSSSENWGIQEADVVLLSTGNFADTSKIYNLTHSVNAKGQLVYNASGVIESYPWQQASGYVRSLLGTANIPSSLLVTTAAGYTATNRKVVESIDKTAGTYSAEETYTYLSTGVLPQGRMALEECSINLEKAEGALTTVGIQGTINGLETNNPISSTGVSRYHNASGYFAAIEPHLYTRTRINSGLSWLHPVPKSKTVGRMPNAGQITYSYSYDTRPPNLIPGSISEEITVNDTYPGQNISEIPVIGGNQPVLQYMNSRSAYKRTLQINVNMDAYSPNWNTTDVNSSGLWTASTVAGVRNWLIGSKPSVLQTSYFQGIYDAVNPTGDAGVIATKVFYGTPQESWNARTGQYSYTADWTYRK